MEHHFDIDIAKEYGVPEAILLYNINYWILHNKANNRNFFDGRYWTYNSTKAFTELFPYYTYWQIHRALKHLEEAGVIVTGNYNKMPMDKTLWYSLTDKGKDLCFKSKCNLEKTKIEFGLNQNGICEKPKAIPNNNTDNNTNNNIIMEPPLKKERKQFKPPTLEQVKEYAQSRNSSVDVKFFFDFYDAAGWYDSKGNPVKNWKQKFITWERRDAGNEQKANIPAKQRQRFMDIMSAKLGRADLTDIEVKVFNAFGGFMQFKARKAGEEDKWLEKLCRKYAELGA